jgi:hypothetical protein
VKIERMKELNGSKKRKEWIKGNRKIKQKTA